MITFAAHADHLVSSGICWQGLSVPTLFLVIFATPVACKLSDLPADKLMTMAKELMEGPSAAAIVMSTGDLPCGDVGATCMDEC